MTTTNVLWRQYKEFSGCLIRGTDPILPQDPKKHMSCAAWLTAEAEAPSYGFVQSYDGAGISAGLLHNILVFPKDLTQGDLGLLVRRMIDAVNTDMIAVFGGAQAPEHALDAEVRMKGWTLAADGKFRFDAAHAPGTLVPGDKLRDWVAPPGGKVPQTGADWEQAAKMATLFHELFKNPAARKIQEDFAISWLAGGNRTAELEVYRKFSGHADLDSFISLPITALPSEVHVAMCVYHSFSVNSPAVAAKCLANAKMATLTDADRVVFAKALIRELGIHGRDVWHDQPGDGNNRYDRTRVALWGRADLFPGGKDLMPRDLAP
jgi:hypothetical protein